MTWIRLALARWRLGIQLELRELIMIARCIRSPLSLLVFGLGNDSILWHGLNRGGRTCFIENDPDWHRRITGSHPELEVHMVTYNTLRAQWKELLEQPTRLALTLPDEVAGSRWDAIFVDGPPGWHDATPGRMQSIYMAARLVRPDGDVLVHDAEREVESAYCARYLGRPNLVGSVRGRAVLEHYRVQKISGARAPACS